MAYLNAAEGVVCVPASALQQTISVASEVRHAAAGAPSGTSHIGGTSCSLPLALTGAPAVRVHALLGALVVNDGAPAGGQRRSQGGRFGQAGSRGGGSSGGGGLGGDPTRRRGAGLPAASIGALWHAERDARGIGVIGGRLDAVATNPAPRRHPCARHPHDALTWLAQRLPRAPEPREAHRGRA